ncbi:MAG: tape measure protein [Shewanella sp.]
MTEIASLKIRVDALEAKAAADALSKMVPAAGRAQKAVLGVSSASNALNKVLGITSGYLTARRVLQAAEDWTTLNNRLRLVTGSANEFNSAQENIFRIAQETRQGLTSTATLYQRIAANQKELGITGKETADIVKTINQTLVISGTATASASAALIQLGQAFASGVLRGEELNSVLEQAPALAQSIARGMGVTIGELRKLGEQGILTASAVVQALQEQAQSVEEQFVTITPTVSGALTQLDNSFIQLVGRMDESTGSSAKASKAISDLATVLSDPKTIAAANNLAAGIATAFSGIATATTWVVEAVELMSEEVAIAFDGIGLHDIDRLEAEASRLQSLLDKVRSEGYGPGAAIFENILGDFEENEKRLGQAYDLADITAKLVKQQEGAPPQSEGKAPPPPKGLPKGYGGLNNASGKMSDAAKAAIKEAEALKKAYQSNADVIVDLAEALYQATLPAAELAERQAELRLNDYATKEQIASVRQLSTEMTKLSTAKAQQEELARKREAFGSDVAGTIRGTVDPLSGGAFDDQTARYEAERATEDMRYQEQLARLNEALSLELVTKQEYANMEVELAQTTADRMAQITQARNDMMMNSMGSAFGQMSTDLMAFANEFGEQNSAMFKVAKASAIAQTIIQTYQSAQAAFTSLAGIPIVGPALGAAAAGAAIAGGMARVSAITSQAPPSFDGGGFTGGGARAGGLDGKGGFMAMLHPNETVIDHTKGQGMGGGGGVTVNVIEDKSRAGTQQKRQGADGKENVDVFVSDIMGDGPRARAMQSAFGLSRQGQ